MKMNELIFADCFEIFPELEENSFDIVFTDPDNSVCESDELFRKFFSESRRILKPEGSLILWCPYCLIPRFDEFSRTEGFVLQEMFIPVDRRKIPFTEGYKDRLASCVLNLSFTWQGWKEVFFQGFKPGKFYHSIQKPEGLCQTILKGFQGRKVIDPFAGTGTHPVVAKKLGKSFLAIEKNPDIFAIAEKRMKESE